LISDSNDDSIVQLSGKFLATAFKLNSTPQGYHPGGFRKGDAPVGSVDPALIFQ